MFQNLFKKSSPVGRQGGSWIYGLTASWTSRSYAKQAEEFYIRNVIVSACIKSIADNIASIPVFLTNDQNAVIENHQLLDLLKTPNPNCDYAEFVTSFISYYLLSGDAFIIKSPIESRNTLELWNVRPDFICPKINTDGTVAGFEYRSGEMQKYFPADMAAGFSPVGWMKNFNPIDPYKGCPQVQHAAMAADVHNEIGRWNKATMENDARPAGALTVETTLSDSDFAKIKKEMDETWSGIKNAKRPFLLDNGLKWQQLSLDPASLDFLNNKQDVAREICQAFGYPPFLLGLKGDNTFANYAEARVALYEETIIPLATKMCSFFTRWLLPQFQTRSDLRLSFDVDKIPALQTKRYAAFERLDRLNMLTINEKRELLNYEPVPDGDKVLQPANLLPIGFDLGNGADEASKFLKFQIDNGIAPEAALLTVKAIWPDYRG